MFLNWAIPEKIQTGRVEPWISMEFPGVSKK